MQTNYSLIHYNIYNISLMQGLLIHHTRKPVILCRPMKNMLSIRFYPGPVEQTAVSMAKKLLPEMYKGVSGAFTMFNSTKTVSNKETIYDKVMSNPEAFNYHLYHHLKFFNSPWSKQNFEQQLFDRTKMLLSADPLWRNSSIKDYGNLGKEKGFSLIFPFNQNFISHQFAKQTFDTSKVCFAEECNLDLSAYKDKGITIQNMMEIQVVIANTTPLIKYFNSEYAGGQMTITMNEPLINNMKKTNTQTNPDSTAVLMYSHSNKDKTNFIDAKILNYPEKYLPVLEGNLSIAYDYDIVMHAHRFRGAIITAIKQGKMDSTHIIHYLDALEQLTRKKLTPETVITIKKIFHAVWCDVNIQNFVPSLITEAPVYDLNSLDDVQIKLLKDSLNPENQNTRIASLFPVMGQERDDYHYQIESFIDNMPKEILYDLKDNYTTFVETVKDVALKNV